MPAAPHRHAEPVLVIHERDATLEAHPETSHTEHGFTYLVEGSYRMIHGEPIEARAGTVTVMPAGVPHTPLEGSGLEYWLVAFCSSCVGLDESQLLMSPFRRVRGGTLPVVEIPATRRGHIVDLFRELRAESTRNAPESVELVRSLLLLLLGEVRRGMSPDETAAAPDSLVAGALEFIQERALDPISLRDVAAAVHRTPAHVTATVKRATGYPVGHWIGAARVAEGANRLIHTDESVEAIAAAVGWRDATHFIRQFRRVYGATPAAWRREQRAGTQGEPPVEGSDRTDGALGSD